MGQEISKWVSMFNKSIEKKSEQKNFWWQIEIKMSNEVAIYHNWQGELFQGHMSTIVKDKSLSQDV